MGCLDWLMECPTERESKKAGKWGGKNAKGKEGERKGKKRKPLFSVRKGNKKAMTINEIKGNQTTFKNCSVPYANFLQMINDFNQPWLKDEIQVFSHPIGRERDWMQGKVEIIINLR